MECSICYNEITSATGKVELSCSHPFHFSCLTTWFDKRKLQGAHENCPLCRHEANEFEMMPVPVDDDEDDEDDEDDDESWEEELTLDELAAQERARHRFARYKLINTIEDVQLYAANMIKACWRGYQDRLLYLELIANKEEADYGRRTIEQNKAQLVNVLSREKFLKSIIGLSRTQVKRMAATKIQSIMRMYNMKVIMKAGPMQLRLPPGVWVENGIGRWSKVIMNPEEDNPSNIQYHPLSTVS